MVATRRRSALLAGRTERRVRVEVEGGTEEGREEEASSLLLLGEEVVVAWCSGRGCRSRGGWVGRGRRKAVAASRMTCRRRRRRGREKERKGGGGVNGLDLLLVVLIVVIIGMVRAGSSGSLWLCWNWCLVISEGDVCARVGL